MTPRQLLDQAVGPELSPLVGGALDQESSGAPGGRKTEEDMGLMKTTVHLGSPWPGQGPPGMADLLYLPTALGTKITVWRQASLQKFPSCI